MKNLSRYTWILAVASVAIAMAACGKSGGGNSGPAPVPTGPGVAQTLPPGTPVGFYAQNPKMDQYYINSGSTYNLQSAMNKVLKYAMGTCDRNYADYGYAGCQSWMNGFHDIMIFANGSQASTVKMVVRAMPDTRCQSPYMCSGYWASLPSFSQFILGLFGFNTTNQSGVYNPMVLDMTIWPINNSQGFELRGYPPAGAYYQGGNNLLFQFQVPNGKLEDAAWDFTLAYNGEVAANGRMIRCTNPSCGIQGM